jgi:hypothetical protein
LLKQSPQLRELSPNLPSQSGSEMSVFAFKVYDGLEAKDGSKTWSDNVCNAVTLDVCHLNTSLVATPALLIEYVTVSPFSMVMTSPLNRVNAAKHHPKHGTAKYR